MTARARPAREARTYGGETRELILKAAEKLFAAHGLPSVSMQDIAAEAGVSRATVFNQFGSKILLLDAITARSLENYRAMLCAALNDTEAPTTTLLHRLFRQMGKGIASNQNLYREVFVEIRKVSMGLDGDGASPGLKRETFGILTTIFERGQARGDISRAASAEVLATAFDSLLSGAVIQWLHAQRRGSLPTMLESLVDVFLDGAGV